MKFDLSLFSIALKDIEEFLAGRPVTVNVGPFDQVITPGITVEITGSVTLLKKPNQPTLHA